MYEVKNEHTGKKKVLHRAWLLLWLADYGKSVRCNLMMISDTLPGMVPGQQLEDSGEGLHPVPGDSLQYGLDLTHYMAIIDNPEPMTSHIGCEVRMGVPRQAAGQRILTDCDEEPDSPPMRQTSQLVEQTETDGAPTIVFRVHPNSGGIQLYWVS